MRYRRENSNRLPERSFRCAFSFTFNVKKLIALLIMQVSRSSGDALQRLESISNAVLEALLSIQALQPGGGSKTFPVNLPGSSIRISVSLTLPFTRSISASQLQRLRRQYTALNKQAMGKQSNGELNDERVAHLFAEYLEDQLQ